jgi:hypothetical protein
MYLGVGLVMALILVMLSPAIWVAWWLIADLGERAGSAPVVHHASAGGRRAA